MYDKVSVITINSYYSKVPSTGTAVLLRSTVPTYEYLLAYKYNERNRTLYTKVDGFLFEHKLSWATAHFVRCNGISAKRDSIAPDEVGSSPRKLVLK